jgi:UDP-N-acetylglucosamine 2-epimerase (non-hydrolysing)
MSSRAAQEPRTITVLHIVGARPNYMKMAPVILAAERWNDAGGTVHDEVAGSGSAACPGIRFSQVLVHTGQHYDPVLNDVFFEDLGLRAPDHHLEVGSGSHAVQTARVLERIEPLLLEVDPDLVLVPGDVNSSMAVALACVKLRVPVAHLEAGLRSHDREMPEEHNRVVIDHVADLLFTTCRDADDNLLREGVPADRIRFVGNTMIDTLDRLLPAARAREDVVRRSVGLEPGQDFALVTLHRPSNVDEAEQLGRLLGALSEVAEDVPTVFPAHPRTLARIAELGLEPEAGSALRLTPALGYLEFVALMNAARLVLTDSGGVQEETTALGVPCVTLRTTTERPITVAEGTAVLADPYDGTAIVAAARERLRRARPSAGASALATSGAAAGAVPISRPESWDGHAGERVVRDLARWFAD